ncbi:hypothetical protein [Scytonema millei]|uniref:Uncharacterized protein n=1 Tax=Scytonema millei VB511283 TaxID=1245923 RepID=A0A9X5E642_9CYAN|nr:hypothetical protein [Scytonema millei]NHC35966.1 hypothetical protein [Scytonema millei VB511283]
MKNFKLFRRLGLAVLGVLAFCTSIFLVQPSPINARTAISYQNTHLLALGLVDEIATPHQLGLDYLTGEPAPLVASSELMASIEAVNEKASQMPENFNLSIPLGTNSPIKAGTLPGDSESAPTNCDCDAIGFANAQGQQKSITPSDVEDMTNVEYNNNGNLPATAEAQTVLVADASGSLLQARRVPTLNLVIQNRHTGKRFLLPRIKANVFCRDVLNAFLNGTVTRV